MGIRERERDRRADYEQNDGKLNKERDRKITILSETERKRKIRNLMIDGKRETDGRIINKMTGN